MTKEEIFEYVMNTPHNTNPAILKDMLERLDTGSSYTDPEGAHYITLIYGGSFSSEDGAFLETCFSEDGEFKGAPDKRPIYIINKSSEGAVWGYKSLTPLQFVAGSYGAVKNYTASCLDRIQLNGSYSSVMTLTKYTLYFLTIVRRAPGVFTIDSYKQKEITF